MSSILVVGSLNTDISICVERLPLRGETVLGSGYSYTFGGKGANQAYAARLAGADVTMLGSVGQDKYGEQIIQKLQEAGIHTECLRREVQRPTGTAFVMTDREGVNSITVISGANAACDTEYVRSCQTQFAAANCVLLQLEIPLEAVCSCAALAKNMGKLVVLNPAPAIAELPQELYENVDILTPNETELEQLSGCRTETYEDLILAARRLVEKGIPRVIVTLGSRGALLVEREDAVLIPGRRVQPLDSTGAGDCFNGVLTVALADGLPAREAIVRANVAASISVTRWGAMLSMPNKSEIDAACNSGDWNGGA